MSLAKEMYCNGQMTEQQEGMYVQCKLHNYQMGIGLFSLLIGVLIMSIIVSMARDEHKIRLYLFGIGIFICITMIVVLYSSMNDITSGNFLYLCQ